MEIISENNDNEYSYLEVTINSNKLIQILDKLMKLTADNDKQIKHLKQLIPSLKQSMTINAQNIQKKIKINNQKNQLKTYQQINSLNKNILSIDQQLKKIKNQHQYKIKEQQIILQKIDKSNKKIYFDIEQHNKTITSMQQFFNHQVALLKQSTQQIQKKVLIACKNTETQCEMMQHQIQSMIKQNIKISKQHQINTKNNIQNKSTQNLIIDDEKKDMSLLPNQSILTPKLQSNLQKKYATQGCIPISQTCKTQFKKTVNKEIENLKSNSQTSKISDNSQHIKPHIKKKQNYEQVIKNIQKLKNKLIFQQQNIQLIGKKLQKMAATENEQKIHMKKFDQKKNSQNIAILLKNQLKQMISQLTQNLQKKCFTNIFQKDKQQIMNKFTIIHQILIDKVDKSQMKKNFHFLQQKIKQIIFLIVNDKNQQRNGAIQKLPLKCLSCDKTLTEQSQKLRQNSSMVHRDSMVTSKIFARKVRRRANLSQQDLSTVYR